MIDQIWRKYDTDGNGLLDKREMKQFVSDYVGSTGVAGAAADRAFEAVFRAFDEDGSGSVNKSKVTAFIKKLLSSNPSNSLISGMDKSPSASAAKEEGDDAEQVRSNAVAILANRRREQARKANE